jgi:hypothetical protein
MNTWIYIFAVVVGLLLAISYFLHRRRAAAIRDLTTRLGFHYLGGTLPRSFSFSGAPLDRLSSVWNVIDGERRGTKIIAFDCRIGSGKGSWRRTVIAAESSADFFKTAFNLDLTVDRSGSWTILYQPRTVSFIPPGLMPVTELEAHLNAI